MEEHIHLGHPGHDTDHTVCAFATDSVYSTDAVLAVRSISNEISARQRRCGTNACLVAAQQHGQAGQAVAEAGTAGRVGCTTDTAATASNNVLICGRTAKQFFLA